MPQAAVRVLCVDDDPLVRRVYAAVLRNAGHRVTLAATLDDAVDILETEGFDLLISDYRLGFLRRGTTLLELAARRWPDMRRLLVTGTVPSPQQAEVWSTLAERVLPKPWTPAQLLAVVDPTPTKRS